MHSTNLWETPSLGLSWSARLALSLLMDKPTSWPWDPAPTKFYRVRGQQLLDNTAQPPAGQATRRTLAFGVGSFRPPPAPTTAADTQDDVSAELVQVRRWSCALCFERFDAPTDWRCPQLRDSLLGPSPPWGTFTDAFAGANLIGASHSAGDVTTVLQGPAPRLPATDSATHSDIVTQDQDALEVTSGDMKRRRVDAGELQSAACDPLETAAWEFGDGATTTLTHEEITIDTDLDGGVHMVALVGSVTATEEHPGAPAVIHSMTGSADIYLPRPDSPRGPHDWEEAMLGEALTAYPVRIVQLSLLLQVHL